MKTYKRYRNTLANNLIESKRREKKIEVGQWLIDHPYDSIRDIAKEFMLGKSTIHVYLHELRFINDEMYSQCMKILRFHQQPYYIQTKRRK